MSNVTVIGAQWGDEGKGKIVDWLASRADVVVRFQGGHNAGHTLVVGNQVYKLSLLPSGVVSGKLGIIGNGVVVDPQALLAEIARIAEQGLNVTPETLKIAENVPLILPVHGALDRAREAARGDRKIGTTGRGIGPAYEDKVARRAIRLCDLAEPETLDWKLDELLLHHNTLLAGLGAPTFAKEELLAFLSDVAPKVLPFMAATWDILDDARRNAAAFCSRARRRSCWMWTMGLTRLLPVPTPLLPMREQVLAWDRLLQGLCWALPRHTAPAWARDRSRPNCTMPSAAALVSVGMSLVRLRGVRAAVAGLMRFWSVMPCGLAVLTGWP